MMDRLRRLLRSWYGAVVHGPAGLEDGRDAEHAGGESVGTPPRTPTPAGDSDQPADPDLEERFEQLEGRRLLEQIRLEMGQPGSAPPSAESERRPPAPREEKTIGPAPGAGSRPAPVPPPVEKTIGPAPGGRPRGAEGR